MISFFKEKEKYKRFAEYIVHLIQDDLSAPRESIHTILYRIKDEARLIEKIEHENVNSANDIKPITHKNFQNRIRDIIGIRIICLRLSDILKLKAYLDLLFEEKILQSIGEPNHKRSFVLPLDSDENVLRDLNLKYSGYSSIHYQIKLGKNSDATKDLKEIQAELQLRTILEEAWGEIDHKYRYTYSRIGGVFPEHIHSGFYNLSAYLQAAAMHAEQLCREVENYTLEKAKKKEGALATSQHKTYDDIANKLATPTELEAILEDNFGFKPTQRTLTYIFNRFDKLGFEKRSKSFFRKLFKADRLNKFRTIYYEVLKRNPFETIQHRNIDIINVVNYALFDGIEGTRVANEGLRSTLRWRRDRSMS